MSLNGWKAKARRGLLGAGRRLELGRDPSSSCRTQVEMEGIPTGFSELTPSGYCKDGLAELDNRILSSSHPFVRKLGVSADIKSSCFTAKPSGLEAGR